MPSSVDMHSMDSGLGSDEERRFQRRPSTGSPAAAVSGLTTKEQKQRLNERLLIGCFIDASSLVDDTEVPPVQLPISTTSTTIIEAPPVLSPQPPREQEERYGAQSGTRSSSGNGSGSNSSTINEVGSSGRAGSNSGNAIGEDERAKGALLFRTSIPQYSTMLQLQMNMHNGTNNTQVSVSFYHTMKVHRNRSVFVNFKFLVFLSVRSKFFHTIKEYPLIRYEQVQ